MAQGRKTGGRKAGVPNRVTAAFKDALRFVYEDIGGNAAFSEWAKENPTEFYRICARLIPTEVAASESEGVTIIINRRDSQGRFIEDEYEPVQQLGYEQR